MNTRTDMAHEALQRGPTLSGVEEEKRRMQEALSLESVERELAQKEGGEETSAQIRERVNAARARQRERFAGTGVTCNAKMSSRQVREYCLLDEGAEALIRKLFDKMGLSARAYDKVLKVARTIADLDQADVITAPHISEALRYRDLDKKMQ